MTIQNLSAVPAELRNAQRWVLWISEPRDGKLTKVPYSVLGEMASTIDPTTWTTFTDAEKEYDPSLYNGLGFVISPPYVGIDLDKCRDAKTGEVDAWAREAIAEINSYTELSPSGTGFHIWVKGWLERSGRSGKVEMYKDRRYFTMTGQHVAGTPITINQRDLKEFYRKHIGEAVSDVKDVSSSAKEFKICCDIWTKLGRNASNADVRLELFKKAIYRDKWEKNLQYIDRTIQAAKEKVFGILPSNESELSQIRFTDIEAKSMAWLWENRIPKGKLVMFSGNPDCGKTTVLCDLISHYTTGTQYPDGASAAETGEVLFLGAEDDPADTLKPRLVAAGANTDKVHYVRGIRVTENSKRLERAVALDTDLAAIELALKQNKKIGLVAIDPVTSYFGKSDLNSEQALRKILGPIKELAEAMQVTFVCLGHFNKRSDVNVLHKVGGAVAMTGVARAVWLFMKNPEVDGQFLMLIGKGNLTQKRSGLKYSIIARPVPTGTAPAIDWQGEETMDAENIAETLKNPVERAAAKAEKFLKDFLTISRPSKEIEQVAEQHGIKRTNLWAAKKALDVRWERRGDIYWWLPLSDENHFEHLNTKDDEDLFEHLNT
jgi:putative DNA primase/helicase